MNTRLDQLTDLYRKLDETITNHYKGKRLQPPCSKGCSSCCSQFFEISELEFAVIKEQVDSLSQTEKNELSLRAETLMDLFRENWPDFHETYFSKQTIDVVNDDYYQHPDRYEVTLPCVFLSNEGSCTIYESRPITCRTTGVAYQHRINFGSVCDYIRLGVLTPLWQANLIPFKQDIDSFKWLNDLDTGASKRQYPMFYYMYDYLVGRE
ncbi:MULTISPECIES: YkgJ family cysteine cluster protein [unclassified Fusibacter]|uniref:YkgJ family cysteine cluster protein n=1 Tax=unclassified Fusibacter TaxID=2624464 RepID=UPI0013E981C1|nr:MULTISPECIES: YkgJ family cysteine cluster protein [unclassified Fusibacter]MCK8058520.1 YkgJ family cysteine cluster protein [Fusibacter sp. A2]NPE22711.1 YkgJ family cysteine cluster protein [Fusibacter sp. A1]